MSAQRAGGKSLVLFADRHSLVLSPHQLNRIAKELHVEHWELRAHHEKAWLKLVRKRITRAARP
jgi:hypothetical protein